MRLEWWCGGGGWEEEGERRRIRVNSRRRGIGEGIVSDGPEYEASEHLQKR